MSKERKDDLPGWDDDALSDWERALDGEIGRADEKPATGMRVAQPSEPPLEVADDEIIVEDNDAGWVSPAAAPTRRHSSIPVGPGALDLVPDDDLIAGMVAEDAPMGSSSSQERLPALMPEKKSISDTPSKTKQALQIVLDEEEEELSSEPPTAELPIVPAAEPKPRSPELKQTSRERPSSRPPPGMQGAGPKLPAPPKTPLGVRIPPSVDGRIPSSQETTAVGPPPSAIGAAPGSGERALAPSKPASGEKPISGQKPLPPKPPGLTPPKAQKMPDLPRPGGTGMLPRLSDPGAAKPKSGELPLPPRFPTKPKADPNAETRAEPAAAKSREGGSTEVDMPAIGMPAAPTVAAPPSGDSITIVRPPSRPPSGETPSRPPSSYKPPPPSSERPLPRTSSRPPSAQTARDSLESATRRSQSTPGFEALESLDLALSELEAETPSRKSSRAPASLSSATIEEPAPIASASTEAPAVSSDPSMSDATVPEAPALVLPPDDGPVSISDSSLDALAPPPSANAAMQRSGESQLAKEKPRLEIIGSAPPSDKGAQAAMRSVRSRKPRKETFALVGNTPAALRSRRDLLRELANGASGSTKARLLVACAEIAEQLGEGEDAHDLYESARAADPRDVVALRALRREAVQNEDWPRVASLLEAEAGLGLSAKDRAAAYTALAEIHLERLGDAASAERAARTALGLGGGTVAAALVLAQACFAQDRLAEAHVAIEKASEAIGDERAKAALRLDVARFAEASGTPGRARPHYTTSAEADERAIEALLGVARCARAAGDMELAASSVFKIARVLGEGPAAESFVRKAARMMQRLADKPAEALAAMGEVRGALTLRTRAEVARAAGDAAQAEASTEAWAAATGGTERALALVRLAEWRGERGDLEGADAALRDAALADSSLATIRVVRELLARRAGDNAWLARAVEGSAGSATGGALVAAAKLARAPNTLDRERELLARASAEGESPVTADVLGLDTAASARDQEEVKNGLRRKAARIAPELRAGPLLALASQVDEAEQAAVLGQAHEDARVDPVAREALAWALDRSNAEHAANLWLEQSATMQGEVASYYALCAARTLARGRHSPDAAVRRAFEAKPSYLPAAWAIESVARASGDLALLTVVNERLAEEAADPIERAGRLVRAGLLRAEADPETAVALLNRARELVPGDVILVDLLLRLGDSLDPRRRAELIESTGIAASPELERIAKLRAANLFEQIGDHSRASELYRAAGTLGASASIAGRAAERAELAGGEEARVAERRIEALKAAQTPVQRTRALERLADLDLHHRGDPASAIMSLQSILEIAPGHLPSLRALERYFMEHVRDEDLAVVEERLSMAVGSPRDAAAHARFAARLRLRESKASGSAADLFLIEVYERTEPDLWLARHVAAAAEARGDRSTLARALADIVPRLETPMERIATALRASEVTERAASASEAAKLLAAPLSEGAAHPTAAEELGRMHELSGNQAHAATAYLAAARAARVPKRVADLSYRAARILGDELGDEEGALSALLEVAKVDPAHLDTFQRLDVLLTKRDDAARLAKVTEARVAAGGNPALIVDLHRRLAELKDGLGDRTGAKDSLRAALALEPENADALKRLSELCLADEDYRAAAEALIRIARLRKNRDELRWVFFTLGDIYDQKLPDSARAEAAYKRVLKVEPSDTETMVRLAVLYRRDGNHAASADVLRQLVVTEVDPQKNRGFRLELAEALERAGDPRQAEKTLEDTRRVAPIDLEVLRGFAEFYRRQNAQSALAMHLNRAVNDFRHAIETDPSDAAAWPGLVEVLTWRGRKDAARVCASAAVSIGVVDVQLSRQLDENGGVPGAGAAALDDSLDDMIAPTALTVSFRALMRLAWEAFDKVLPLDLRAIRAEKLTLKEGPLRNASATVARWSATQEIQIFATDTASRFCVPVSASPLAVLVSRDLLASTTEREWTFLLARAAKVARAGLFVAARSDAVPFGLAVAGLIKSYDPAFETPGIDPGALSDISKRVAKNIPRKVKDELRPLCMDVASNFEGPAWTRASLELGSRAAIVATGSMPNAMSALARLSGTELRPSADLHARLEVIRRMPEALALVRFVVSDPHFEARHRAGADRL